MDTYSSFLQILVPVRHEQQEETCEMKEMAVCTPDTAVRGLTCILLLTRSRMALYGILSRGRLASHSCRVSNSFLTGGRPGNS